eukprot:13178860-Ditylum_brightwellii.AAC.1
MRAAVGGKHGEFLLKFHRHWALQGIAAMRSPEVGPRSQEVTMYIIVVLLICCGCGVQQLGMLRLLLHGARNSRMLPSHATGTYERSAVTSF